MTIFFFFSKLRVFFPYFLDQVLYRSVIMSNVEANTLYAIFDASFSQGKKLKPHSILVEREKRRKLILFNQYIDPNVRVAAELELLKVNLIH